jgi:23S rRNA (adenine1618-N6)-methyltransferase
VPEGYLCPPIPGRADYLHYAADLLAKINYNTPPKGKRIKCLDIGTGANCIYPLIGAVAYGWKFTGTEVDKNAIKAAIQNVKKNPKLKNNITIQEQGDSGHFFKGIIGENDHFDLTICNPPFHASAKEARETAQRKNSRLKKGTAKLNLNFGGQSNELWCTGGEVKFIGDMIKESKQFANKVMWFTSLVSKKSSLKTFYAILKQEGAVKVETIAMGQGNKSSRIIAWTFLSKDERIKWRKERWT